jgi:hypothetical protein
VRGLGLLQICLKISLRYDWSVLEPYEGVQEHFAVD